MEEATISQPTSQEHAFQEYPDVRTLLAWTAPGRPFRKKHREFYLSVLAIVFLIEVILFLFHFYIPMMAVGALVFLAFVMATIPPTNFSYKITTEGIKIEDHFYIWEEVYDFYFKKIEGMDTLVVTTVALIPGELKLPLGTMSRDHVRRVLLHFLPYRETVIPTFMEKSAEWLSKTFPLERAHPQNT